jgi:site-specific DNA-methyltransferase (adenine-specific)
MEMIHFVSSKRMDWKTPKWLYQELDDEFGFDFDPCPTNPTFDGLQIDWGKCNYVNPPYGRSIKAWVYKAWWESRRGATCVMLIPARTDTSYWHDVIFPFAKEIRFMPGRLKFDDGKNPAPFASALVVFGQ